MNIEELFQDKTIKAKAKVSTLGDWLLSNDLPVDELLAYTDKTKATNKATCIEAIEYATKKQANIADESVFLYMINALKDEEPRVKWESARVIGNVAKQFPDYLAKAIINLLANAEHSGTVVRWATAYALAEILKLKTDNNINLLTQIKVLAEKEEDNGVKKKYLDGLKKVKAL